MVTQCFSIDNKKEIALIDKQGAGAKNQGRAQPARIKTDLMH